MPRKKGEQKPRVRISKELEEVLQPKRKSDRVRLILQITIKGEAATKLKMLAKQRQKQAGRIARAILEREIENSVFIEEEEEFGDGEE